MGSSELQGGKMLIIKRPQAAKFMFIWAARRKCFPVSRNDGRKLNLSYMTEKVLHAANTM